MQPNQLEGLLSNPLFQMGMGLLSGRYSQDGNPFGNALQAMQRSQQAQTKAEEREEKRRQREIKEQRGRAMQGLIMQSLDEGHPAEGGGPGALLTPEERLNREIAASAALSDPTAAARMYMDMNQFQEQMGLSRDRFANEEEDHNLRHQQDQTLKNQRELVSQGLMSIIPTLPENMQGMAQVLADSLPTSDPNTVVQQFMGMANMDGESEHSKTFNDVKAMIGMDPEQAKKFMNLYRTGKVVDVAGAKVFNPGPFQEVLSTAEEENQAAADKESAKKVALAGVELWDELHKSAIERKQNAESAQMLLKKLRSGELRTGLYRGMAYKILPTADQEQLDALARSIIRVNLKMQGGSASDTDVNQEAAATFGSTRSFQFNETTMEWLLDNIAAQDAEYGRLSAELDRKPYGTPVGGTLPVTPPAGLLDGGDDVPVPDWMANDPELMEILKRYETP